jgi:NhaP-type Na+/H+ or K+/H+ antiporter
VRLLLIGLPLTIAFGLALAWLIFGELGFYEIALIATMLAPTDAALGKAVVTNPAVPAKVRSPRCNVQPMGVAKPIAIRIGDPWLGDP